MHGEGLFGHFGVEELEEELGFDPFSLETEAYYPVTYGDFLKFYMSHQPG